jgi:cell division protein DivIC
MKFLNHIPSWIRSKYFISFAFFCAIIFFFDKNDILTQLNRRQELKELQQSREYYNTQITAERKELELLKTNPATLEKYAREKYLMKRDNEDLFLVPEKKEDEKN